MISCLLVAFLAVSHFDASNNLIYQHDAEKGLTIRYTYDSANHITSCEKDYGDGELEREAFEYDSQGHLLRSHDIFGYTTEYRYDAQGHLISCQRPDVGTFYYTYDANGRLIETKDPLGLLELRSYSPDGKLERIKYPDATLEKFGWEGKLLTRRRFRNGLFSLYKHDAEGNIIYERTFTRREEAEMWEAHTRYENKRLVSQEDPMGHTTFYFYNSKGQCISKRTASASTKDPNDPRASRTDFTYNEQGRVIQEKRWVSASLYLTCNKEYDEKGRLIREELVGAPPVTTRYDAFDNITEVRVGNLTLQKASFTHGTRLSESGGKKIVYSRGKRFTQQSLYPNGLLETTLYDALGRIIETSASVQSKIMRRTLQEYDSAGNLIKVTTLENDQECISSFEYGPGNKLTRDQEGARYTYDQFGELSTIEKNGELTLIEYNSEGLVRKKCIKRGENEPEIILLADYDHLRRPICVCSEWGTHTSRSYNHLGLLSEEKIQDDYGVYSIRFEYDRLGRMTKMLLPDGSYVVYEFSGPLLKKIHRFAKGEKTARYCHEIVERDEAGRSTVERLISNDTCLLSYEGVYLNGRTIENKLNEAVKERDCYGHPLTLLHNNQKTALTRNHFGELMQERGLFQECASQECARFECAPVQKKTPLRSFSRDGFNRPILSTAPEIRRLFYFGSTEIGALDKQGNIIELKIPQEIQNGAGIGAIAIEIKKRVYAPVFDLTGNIAYLLRQKTGNLAEYYHYSQSGKERIYKGDGEKQEESRCKNPWRWKGERQE